MQRASRSRIGLAVGFVVVVLLVSGGAALLSSRAPTSPLAPSTTSFGAAQLAAARASLQRTSDSTGLLTGAHSGSSSPADATPSGGPAYRWQPVPALPGQPAPRYFPNLVWDASDGYVLLYGGDHSSAYTYSDTWTYLNGTWTNITTTVTGQPPAVWAAGFAYDPSESQVVLFGGNYKSGESDWTWAYHDKVWTNLTATAGTPPSNRVAPGMITDTAAGDILLFGGLASAGGVSDTWTFDDDHWANITTTSGVPADFPQASYLVNDPAGAGPLLFGQASENVTGAAPYFAGTYEFVAGAWTNVTADNPNAPIVSPNFDGATAEFVPALSAVVLYTPAQENRSGGVALGPYTWFFQGGAWVNATVDSGPIPAVVVGGGSFVAPYDDAFVFWGGENALTESISTTAWALAAEPSVTAAATHTVVDAGASISFTGTVSLGVGGVSASWSFGDGGTETGLSATHSFATAGLYTVTLTVTDLLGQTSSASVAIQVNPIPTVGLVGPVSPYAGSQVGFAALPRGGTPAFSYSWNLGNGVTSTSPTPSTSYASAGSYTVTVTLTDSTGATATNSTTVTVLAAPSSPSLTSGTGLLLLIGIIVLAAVAVVLGVLLLRKGGGSRPPPSPYSSAPPPSGSPPPGAGGSPPS